MTERSAGERFVNALRTRAEPVRLAPEGAPAWTIRAQGAEVWDAVRLVVMPSTPVREVKRAAIAALMPDVHELDGYVLKLGGAEVDEGVTLADTGATEGSTLLVVSRRKRPIR